MALYSSSLSFSVVNRLGTGGEMRTADACMGPLVSNRLGFPVHNHCRLDDHFAVGDVLATENVHRVEPMFDDLLSQQNINSCFSESVALLHESYTLRIVPEVLQNPLR